MHADDYLRSSACICGLINNDRQELRRHDAAADAVRRGSAVVVEGFFASPDAGPG
jgi:hypothetical protein